MDKYKLFGIFAIIVLLSGVAIIEYKERNLYADSPTPLLEEEAYKLTPKQVERLGGVMVVYPSLKKSELMLSEKQVQSLEYDKIINLLEQYDRIIMRIK